MPLSVADGTICVPWNRGNAGSSVPTPKICLSGNFVPSLSSFHPESDSDSDCDSDCESHAFDPYVESGSRNKVEGDTGCGKRLVEAVSGNCGKSELVGVSRIRIFVAFRDVASN